MSDEIRNPKVREEVKDLHVYVSDKIHKIVDDMVNEGLIKTKTEYVADLIHKDLRERKLAK